MGMKIVIIMLISALFFIPVALAGPVSFTVDSGAYNDVPEPRLRYPINETAILTGNDPLEFKWWNDLVGMRGFTLKLYKGYNMYAANLIHKEDLPSEAASVKIGSDLFEDGQVYTWSLIRFSFSGYKSDKSFNSFKVIKK
jgi:hypothetical protein